MFDSTQRWCHQGGSGIQIPDYDTKTYYRLDKKQWMEKIISDSFYSWQENMRTSEQCETGNIRKLEFIKIYVFYQFNYRIEQHFSNSIFSKI